VLLLAVRLIAAGLLLLTLMAENEDEPAATSPAATARRRRRGAGSGADAVGNGAAAAARARVACVACIGPLMGAIGCLSASRPSISLFQARRGDILLSPSASFFHARQKEREKKHRTNRLPLTGTSDAMSTARCDGSVICCGQSGSDWGW